MTQTEITDLAYKIAWCWKKFALNLAPGFFQLLGNIDTIDSDQRYRSAEVKAQAMLETWRNHLSSGATRRVLIVALCRKNVQMRAQAGEVFGSALVDIVSSAR